MNISKVIMHFQELHELLTARTTHELNLYYKRLRIIQSLLFLQSILNRRLVLNLKFTTSYIIDPSSILRVQHQDQNGPWCALLDQFILFIIPPAVLLEVCVGNIIGVSSGLLVNFSTVA